MKTRDKGHLLDNVFTSIQDGISILNTDMTIARVNPAMEKWYSHSMPLVGKKCYQAYHLRNAKCNKCPSIRTLKTGKPAYEISPKTAANGKVVGWFDLYSFPLVNRTTGKLAGVIEYVRDITKQEKARVKLEALNKKLTASNRELKTIALKDPHTGLYNHRYLEEVIEAEFSRARRYVHPISVIMMDIDYFKSINDVYGHKFGDLILKQFSSYIKRMVRKYDVVIRYGGEEFIIISPSTSSADATLLAQRLIDAVSLYNFGNREHAVKLKLSIAVVSYPDDKVHKSQDLVNLAEQILNSVKEQGGNKVLTSKELRMAHSGNHGILEPEKKEDVSYLRDRLYKLTRKGNQSVVEAIFAFAKTLELKDHYTGEHVERTVHYAMEIAKALHLSPQEVNNIKQAAVLHDLGKIGISDKILMKRAKLTKKEYEEIKKHPQIGVDIIRPIHFMHDIIPLIFYHHERWDGKGYPTGIKGEEIPIGARIIALADVYQALTSDRPYRKAYARKEAVDIVKKASGTQFDPIVVKAFLEVLRKEKKRK